MAKLTAAEYVEKQARKLKGATEDIRRGIERTTEAPGAKAAKQAQVMKAKVVESIDSGKYARNVSAVTLEDWKDKAINKGIGRIAAGIDAAKVKNTATAEKLLQNVDAAKSVVDQTPRGDLETNLGRMVTFAREMAKRPVK